MTQISSSLRQLCHTNVSTLNFLRLYIISFRAVIYRDNKEVFVSNPTEFPETADSTCKVKEIQEPVVKASIIVPKGTSRRVTFVLPLLMALS